MIKPNVGTTIDRQSFISGVVSDLRKAVREELDRSTRTCINCLHFDEPAEVCRRYDNQRPPARIIATGCDGHEDEIPF